MSDIEREVQRHGTMYLISTIGITLVGFLATMFYAHWIGPEILGDYFIFLSYYAITGLFIDLGVAYAASYYICQGRDQDEYFTAGLVIRILLWVGVSSVLLALSSHFGDLEKTGLIWALVVVLGISTLINSFGTAISSSNRLGLAASVSLIDNITRIVVQVTAVFMGFQLYGLIGGLVLGMLIEIVLFIRYIDYRLKKFSWSHVKSIFSFSSWAFLSTTCAILMDNTNLPLIAYFMSRADAGIYGVCWTFSAFTLFISTALCNTLGIKVSRWKSAGDWNAITIALSRSSTYALILAIPMLIGGALLGEPLLYYLYGASFATGALALVIVIGARVMQSLFQIYSQFLLAIGNVRYQFFGLFSGFIVSVPLAVALIPIWGIAGAATASLASAIVCTVSCRHFIGKTIPVQVDRGIVKDIIIATAIMILIILPVDLVLKQSLFTTVMLVCIGGAGYLISLYGLNAQLRNDVRQILKIRWFN